MFRVSPLFLVHNYYINIKVKRSDLLQYSPAQCMPVHHKRDYLIQMGAKSRGETEGSGGGHTMYHTTETNNKFLVSVVLEYEIVG